MLMPKRTKHRKMFRGRMTGRALRGNTVTFGEYGLQALEPSWISNKQIEACRVVINRTFKREGKVYIRIFPDKPITARPAGVRMGKGKGNVEGWVAVVRPGRVLFEVAGVDEKTAIEAFRKATMKLPISCKVIKKEAKIEKEAENIIETANIETANVENVNIESVKIVETGGDN